MINPKIGICVCARLNSRRLPGKILCRIGQKRALRILLEHVIISNKHYPVVLAIPKSPDDDLIIEAVEEDNIPVEIYRGEDASPLHRLYAVAKMKEWDYVVRVTADDILIDLMLLKHQINYCLKSDLDYVWMGKCPEGCAAEVIRTDTLEKVIKKVGNQPIEYISYLLKGDGIRGREYFPFEPFTHQYRLTLDYPEDLTMLRVVLANMPHDYSTLDIIHFLSRNRQLLRINALPKVSVYIVNRNYSRYLTQAIQSVLNQTFDNWELHIWDDYSDDESLKTITRLISGLNYSQQKKIKVFANNEHLGLPATCNKALQEARGRYILRLDSDDVLNPEALEIMSKNLDSAIKIHGVFADYIRIDEKGIDLGPEENTAYHPGCCMLARGCVNEIKYREGLEYGEGKEFLKRFLELYKVKKLDDVLWAYRKHDKQKTAVKK